MRTLTLLILCLLTAPAVSAQDAPDQSPKGERPVNRLANETSPYLLQHKHNPVDWYPWGKEALERARREDRPIFLSIGYSACHWCHVMEHESFMDARIAALMNQRFVNIKVDREERPDLDEIYMTAVQRLTGRGGWPMSVFLTPDLKPFFGGTYYPPTSRSGMPGFDRVLEHIDTLWKTRRDEVTKAADDMASDLQRLLKPKQEPGEPEPDMVKAAAAQSAEHFDPLHGGFGHAPHHAPKFPHAAELTMLLRHHGRTGDAQARTMVDATLTRMALGGLYDQLGGGFHRYSVDRVWLVPHFEKMLYDNTQLARLYTEAFAQFGKPLYQRIARQTLDYLVREMQDADGGFHSTTDADSEGVEGKYFVWTMDELKSLLGDDAELVAEHFGVTAAGNFEDVNVLALVRTEEELAKAREMDVTVVTQKIKEARNKMLEARSKRVPPRKDDKVIASWNGLAISALAYGHQIFGNEEYRVAAQRAADFVWEHLQKDGRLFRTWRGGHAHLTGYLEDYTFLAEGLLVLFESDFDPKWLVRANTLLDQVVLHFASEDGSYWFTPDDHEELVARSRSVTESSWPSGTSMAVLAFLRSGLLTADPSRYEVGVQALRANHEILRRLPAGCPTLMLGVLFHLDEPREIVIAGPPDDPRTKALLAAVRRNFPPHQVVVLVHDGNREALSAVTGLVAGKTPVQGVPAAYVCRIGFCAAPITDPARLTLQSGASEEPR